MILDFSNLDTTPGSGALFAPPTGFTGEYLEWLAARARACPGFCQYLLISIRHPVAEPCGPGAEALRTAQQAMLAAARESLDTTPKTSGRFQAPEDTRDYLAWFRRAYKEDKGFKSALHTIAKWRHAPLARGPHAADLQHAINRMREQIIQ